MLYGTIQQTERAIITDTPDKPKDYNMMPGKSSPRNQSVSSQLGGVKSPPAKSPSPVHQRSNSATGNLGTQEGTGGAEEKREEVKEEDKEEGELDFNSDNESVYESSDDENEEENEQGDAKEEVTNPSEEVEKVFKEVEEKKEEKKKEEAEKRKREANEKLFNSGKVIPDSNSRHEILSKDKYFVKRRTDEDKIVVQIKVEGKVSGSTVTKLDFTFGQPRDITASIDRRNVREGKEPSPLRIGMRDLYVKYPDGSSCSTLLVSGCVIQNRTDLGSQNNILYGINNVTIGVPTGIFHHLLRCGQKGKVNIANKDNVGEHDDCFWYQMDLGSLNAQDTGFISPSGFAPCSIRNLLMLGQGSPGSPKNYEADIAMNVSVTQTAPKESGPLNLQTGNFTPSFKPVSMTFRAITNKRAPPFVPKKRDDYGIERTTKDMATPEFLELMLSGLNTGM